MIANFAPRRGGTASFVILLGDSRLDVRTSRKVGVATAEFCVVYQLSFCASGSMWPGRHCSAAGIDSHQTASWNDSDEQVVFWLELRLLVLTGPVIKGWM